MGGKKTTIPINKGNLEKALKKAGISKYRLAKEMPMDLRHLQRCINEYQAFSHEKLMRLCEVLNVSPEYLTGWHDWDAMHMFPVKTVESFEEYKDFKNHLNYQDRVINTVIEIGEQTDNVTIISTDQLFLSEHFQEIETLIANAVSEYIDEHSESED